MEMKKYKEIIAIGFSSEMELNAFLSTIENDESISDLTYYNLRYAAIERFYENKEYWGGIKKMVIAAILSAILGAGGTICIVTLYALHRLTGGKMSMKKWLHINFDF